MPLPNLAEDIPTQSLLEAAAKLLSNDPNTWVRLGSFLYREMTQRQPLSNDSKD